MEKIRVYELAKEYKMTSKNLIAKLNNLDIDVKNHMSVLTPEDYQKFLDYLDPTKTVKTVEQKKEAPKPAEKEKKEPAPAPKRKPEQKSDRPARKPQQDKPKDKPKATPVEADEKRRHRDRQEKKKTEKPEVKTPKVKSQITTPLIEEDTDDQPKRKTYKKRKRGTHAQYKKTKDETVDLTGQTVEIDEVLTLQELANTLHLPATELIMKFMEMGEMYSMNSMINFDNAEILAMEYDIKLERKQTLKEIQEEEFDYDDKEENLVHRAPVVTVMGHVDHGKTSLLDKIRSTSITRKEAGGITQHIGASEITHEGKRIVFLDTPGHEAFTTLRARGAQVTDIAILVVAADDGVKPQTVEAIHHIQDAGVPMLVAINKMDKPGVNPDRVKQELTEHGVLVEEWGGDVVSVNVSALTGENIDSLLEMILLLAEVQELKANPKRPGVGFIIEANISKGMGVTATVLLEKGTMKIGDSIFAGGSYGRVRTMINDKGKRIKSAGPSTAFEISGLNELPQAGDKIYVTEDEQTARNRASENAERIRDAQLRETKKVASLDTFLENGEEGGPKQLNIILRADVHGSVEAIKQSIEKIEHDEVTVNLVKAQVGAITEADILLATASQAIIFGFNVRPNNNITAIAERENVEIRTYRIIYDIINDVKDALSGLLDPEEREEVEGNIEVRETFKVPGSGTIAGGYVQKGKISRSSQVRLIRDGIVIYEGEVSSLRRFKDDVKQVQTGFECGIGLKNYNDIKEGDIIETFLIKEIERNLES